MILIADSGSTKTTWLCLGNEGVTTLGINPIRDNEEAISKAIERGREALYNQSIENGQNSFQPQDVDHVFFYGAGCIPPYSTTVKRLVQRAYPNAEVQVESDMMGAALALCGHNEGIACILGTGSNSCHFDGKKIINQTPALGYILGDEGSGASLGKRLVGDILKKQLPLSIQNAFYDETALSQHEIIDRVYRQPMPNMFLAGLTPFLARHLDNSKIEALVIDEFRRFLRRNIKNYGRPELPVHFVGGITATFAKQLQIAIEKEGLILGQIMAHPIVGMGKYHLEAQNNAF